MNRSTGFQKDIKFQNNAVTTVFSSTYKENDGFTADAIIKIGPEKYEYSCHRLILAASSDLLRSIIESATPGTIPVILLPDLNASVIEFVMTYIYYGEVQIPAYIYADFVDACKLLQLKGPTDEIQVVKAGEEDDEELAEVPMKLEDDIEVEDFIETVELTEGSADDTEMAEESYVEPQDFDTSSHKRMRKTSLVGKVTVTPEIEQKAQDRLVQAVLRAYTSLGVKITPFVRRHIRTSRIVIENGVLVRGIHFCGLCDSTKQKEHSIRYKVFSTGTGVITFLTDRLKMHLKKEHANLLNFPPIKNTTQ